MQARQDACTPLIRIQAQMQHVSIYCTLRPRHAHGLYDFAYTTLIEPSMASLSSWTPSLSPRPLTLLHQFSHLSVPSLSLTPTHINHQCSDIRDFCVLYSLLLAPLLSSEAAALLNCGGTGAWACHLPLLICTVTHRAAVGVRSSTQQQVCSSFCSKEWCNPSSAHRHSVPE